MGSAVYTDGLIAYQRPWELGYLHAWVDHAAAEFVRGAVHTQGFDGCWGMLKRELGPIGGVRHVHLPAFVGEQVWRYNHRHVTRGERIAKLLTLL